MLSFNKVYEFGNFDKFGKRTFFMIIKDMFDLTDYEIEFINLKSKVDIINSYIIETDVIQGVPQNIDNEKIYIFKNEKINYYIINKIIYYSNDRKNFEKMNNEDINQDENFVLYILSKKNKKFNPTKKIIK